ncbi:MAG: Fic family protein [Bifidobacterium choerinum]
MSASTNDETNDVVPNDVRRRNVDLALQSVALEDGRIDGNFADAFIAYADGEVDEDRLVELAVARYAQPCIGSADQSAGTNEAAVDPYLIPGTQVLRNLVGARDAETLSTIEFTWFTVRSIKLQTMRMPALGTVRQLQQIHHYLFQDVYDWAGTLRTVTISKAYTTFLSPHAFITGIPYCERALADDHYLRNLSRRQFVERMSVHYDDFNVLHPFREGNGRAQRFFWDLVAQDAGWQFDWRLIGKQENDVASARAMLAGDHAPLIRMFDSIVKPLSEHLTTDEAALRRRVDSLVARHP